MGFFRGPNIVTDGLILALDAASPKSYPGSGTTWYDLTTNSLDATLYNGVSFSTNKQGTMVFDGVNDYGQISSSTLTAINIFTFELWFNRTGIATTTPPYDRIFQKDGGYSGYPAWGWSIAESDPATISFLSAYGSSNGEANNGIGFSGNDQISLNEWNCLATTLDSNLLAMYLPTESEAVSRLLESNTSLKIWHESIGKDFLRKRPAIDSLIATIKEK
jgi:hypothetical protein